MCILHNRAGSTVCSLRYACVGPSIKYVTLQRQHQRHRRQSWGIGGVTTPRFWAGGREESQGVVDGS